MRGVCVAEVMQPEVAFLTPDEALDLADDLMNLGEIRHLPVVENEQLVGLVSHRDLMAAGLSRQSEAEPKARREFLKQVKIRDVMQTDLVIVEPKLTLAEAAARMLEHRIGALPVVLEGRLVGILTETDLMRYAYLRDDAAPASSLARRLVELRQMGDELRVQAALGRAEAQDLWADLEGRLETLGADLTRARAPGDGVLGTLVAGVQGLLQDLRSARSDAAPERERP